MRCWCLPAWLQPGQHLLQKTLHLLPSARHQELMPNPLLPVPPPRPLLLLSPLRRPCCWPLPALPQLRWQLRLPPSELLAGQRRRQLPLPL